MSRTLITPVGAVAYAVVVIATAGLVHLSRMAPGRTVAPEPSAAVPVEEMASFQAWREEVMREALDRGIDRAVVSRALRSFRPLTAVVAADRAQARSSPSLDAYLAKSLTPERTTRGRQKLMEHGALLARIERRFGVPARVLVAIWGVESAYGGYRSEVPAIQALATLAWDPRRASYFRAELFDALRIAQREGIAPESMLGSWAGAMGQPQFMPSSYLRYAVDFDGDGRRDIWNSTADVLASIANYLRSFGWRRDETWGREIRLPSQTDSNRAREFTPRSEGCGAVRSLTSPRRLREWSDDGVRAVDGSALPRSAVDASLVLTADTRRFLVYRNYEALLAYNCSHYYSLSVALLAEGIH